MADISGGQYLSLPQYEGCFQMPGVHPTTPLIPSPEEDKYTKDEVMEIMQKVMTDQDMMYDKIHQTMDRLFYPLHKIIASIRKTMEEVSV